METDTETTPPTYTLHRYLADLIVGLPDLALLALLVVGVPVAAIVATLIGLFGVSEGFAFAFASPAGIAAALVAVAVIADR